MGTITPDGTGDVYSYAGDEDDAVLNPQLGVHLQRLGIDVNVLRKTEKSTGKIHPTSLFLGLFLIAFEGLCFFL